GQFGQTERVRLRPEDCLRQSVRPFPHQPGILAVDEGRVDLRRIPQQRGDTGGRQLHETARARRVKNVPSWPWIWSAIWSASRRCAASLDRSEAKNSLSRIL